MEVAYLLPMLAHTIFPRRTNPGFKFSDYPMGFVREESTTIQSPPGYNDYTPYSEYCNQACLPHFDHYLARTPQFPKGELRMSTIFIVSGNSLETFFEDTMEYLFEKYHPHTPENPNFTLTQEMEQSAHFAEAFMAGDLPDHIPKNRMTRRSRIY